MRWDDLRPISLTAQVSKVMEGFVLESLTSEVGHQLDPKQFALPMKSTTQAPVYLLHSFRFRSWTMFYSNILRRFQERLRFG